AKAFARERTSVVITGRDKTSLKSAERDLSPNTMALKSNVSRLADIDQAMARIQDQFKKIDALFVNASVGKFVPFDQVTESFYDDIMNMNLKNTFFTVHKALPLLAPGSAVV